MNASVSADSSAPNDGDAEPTSTPAILAAAKQEPASHVPVWFMRQAGRSLPEYKAIRGEGTILNAIQDPERAAEITLQPVRRYGTDAAILFSDIVTPVFAAGFGIDITPGVGPTCEEPFASRSDLERLRPLDPPVDLPYQRSTIDILMNELDVPLIGFAGGPFTVASYLVEGRPSRDFAKVKSLMTAEPKLWHELCERVADNAIATLTAQVDAGAEMIQLFDSWAGSLRPEHYREYVQPHSAKVLAAMADLGVPRIHFGINTGELLPDIADAGAEVVGVDWRTPLPVARERTGGRVALQGNLDPAMVLAPWEVLEAEVLRVLDDNAGHPGHIFNLGHGVLPQTDPEQLERVIELVHRVGRTDGPHTDGSV